MIESISTSSYQQSGFTDYSKKKNVESSPPQSGIVQQDKVVIKNKKPEQKAKVSKMQIASLGVGGLTSVVFMIYLFKMMSPFGKNKQLLKDIQNADIPDHVRKKLELEYGKLKNSFMDVDGNQNYIKNILRINWKKPENKIIDIEKAKKILDEDHVGLSKVKDEVIGFLKVQNYNLKHNIDNNGPLIVCLDGPPGVGKTSIAESIAKAMDKPFERISLAGVSNKSFIKGAERVFKSSEPGQIIKSIQNAGVGNPVILIDEIDKMGSSLENGDPAFALLDVLEPKQCKKFTDENVELPFDLSNVTFVITSNDINRIPAVLKDRLSIIHIPAYSKEEKIDICEFNKKKMMAESKINSSQVEFSKDGIEEIVNLTTDQGARRTIENLKGVFTNIKEKLETNGNDEKLIVNKDFVNEALKNRKDAQAAETANDSSGQNISFEKLIELIAKALKPQS